VEASRFFHLVTDPANCLEVVHGVAELHAKAPNVNVYGAAASVIVDAPNTLEELPP
jgi:hypothetical protein